MNDPVALAYLDVDDEITSAVERIRRAAGGSLALVLPAGSRLGTSRLNFRLIEREAARHGTRIAVVSPEAPTRAVAEAAGIAAFATVVELEAAGPLAALDDGERGRPATTGGAAPRTTAPTAGATGDRAPLRGTTGIGGARGRAGAAAPGAAPRADGGVSARRAGPNRTAAVAVLGALGLAAVIGLGGLAAVSLLPSASVTVVVRPTALDPVSLRVAADPTASVPDAAAGVIPAERRTFPLAVDGTFEATGIRVTETAATGIVRWQNCDPTRPYTIPAGTTVRTKDRVAFATDEAVFLPVATLTGRTPKLTCQTRDVGITARKKGTAGNVAADAIDVVPALYNAVVIRVSNPAATSGGTRTETPLVAQADVDAAVAALTARLDAALADEVARLAGDSGDGAGSVVYPATANRTEAVAEPSPQTLVGSEVASFTLALAATGSVLAVDAAPLTALAEERLRETVPAGLDLLAESVEVTIGEGRVEGGSVSFDVSASGRAVRAVAPEAVREAVAGLPLADARAALAAFGEGSIEVWPDFVTKLPETTSDRLTVDVRYEGAP